MAQGIIGYSMWVLYRVSNTLSWTSVRQYRAEVKGIWGFEGCRGLGFRA